MTGVYPQIDLSALPAPAALDAWSFNAIVSAELSDFTARMTAERSGEVIQANRSSSTARESRPR